MQYLHKNLPNPYANYIADVEITITDYVLLSSDLASECVDGAALTISTQVVQLSNNDYYDIRDGNELIITGQILGADDGNYIIAEGTFATDNGSVFCIKVESTDEETHITSIDFEAKITNIVVEEVWSNSSTELTTDTQTTEIVYTAAHSYEDENTGDTIDVDGSWGLKSPVDENDDWQVQTFASESVWKFYKGTKVRVVGNTTKKDPPEDPIEEWTIVKEDYTISYTEYDETEKTYTYLVSQTTQIDGFQSNCIEYYSSDSMTELDDITEDDITSSLPDEISIKKDFSNATISIKIDKSMLERDGEWLFIKFVNYADNVKKIVRIIRDDELEEIDILTNDLEKLYKEYNNNSCPALGSNNEGITYMTPSGSTYDIIDAVQIFYAPVSYQWYAHGYDTIMQKPNEEGKWTKWYYASSRFGYCIFVN